MAACRQAVMMLNHYVLMTSRLRACDSFIGPISWAKCVSPAARYKPATRGNARGIETPGEVCRGARLGSRRPQGGARDGVYCHVAHSSREGDRQRQAPCCITGSQKKS